MEKRYYPTLEQARQYEADYRTVPVTRTILSDRCTTIETLRILKSVSRHCFLLESLEDSGRWGRYTFLGYQPRLEFTCQDGVVRVRNGFEMKVETRNPGEIIRQIVRDNRSPKIPGLPPFTGGLMGYFSYDYIKYAEPTLNLEASDQESFKDVDLMLFDKLIAFDNLKQTVTVICNAKTDALEENYRSACLELDAMVELLLHGTPAPDRPLRLKSDFTALFDKERYCQMVETARHYIYEGDIFQVVLSNRLQAQVEGSLLDTYRLLRASNPSPYMFYISSDDVEIVGASPETLVKLQDGVLHTFPLAGTRPRGRTEAEDQALERELLADPKELSEHNMLVDLGRNDIGRLSKFGTVEVEKYLSVERYSHVMHIGSTVRGEIRDDRDAVDAVGCVLPAGTLSGAPKLRACEIIHELEGNKRGIYGGAIGYIDFTGNLDTCIAIRLAFQKNGTVYVRSGAGIVADSVPEKEYQECINKAAAVMDAIRASEGGIDQ
ncbi:MAG: anthranilate synthase component I family protein [Clostridiales bacterium]|nr:anthranilate synthase component I family protein [Clostridiales bacterium]MCD7801856.1 anthranilate synthase component I family protein [Clostridiales bacterium]